MKWRKIVKFILIVGLLLNIVGCLSTEAKDSEDVSTDVKQGKINFGTICMPSTSLANSYTFSENTPTKVVLEYRSLSDTTKVKTETFELLASGDDYDSNDFIVLEEGKYQLTAFNIFDSSDNLIYITPKSGSYMAKITNISTPLPYNFTVEEGEIKYLKIQVIEVNSNSDPDDFGYTTFSFDILDIIDLSFNVFEYSTSSNKYIEAYSTFIAEFEEDGIVKRLSSKFKEGKNTIRLKKRDSYTFYIKKEGYYRKKATYSLFDLEEESHRVFSFSPSDKLSLFFEDSDKGRARREEWWNDLEDQWKIAFNREINLSEDITYKPNDDEIKKILNTTNASFNRLDLTNLSGLECLLNLTDLDCSYNLLTNLEGLENLVNLKSLNCSYNNLTSLSGIGHLINLVKLDCYGNQLESIRELMSLNKIEKLDCSYNQIKNLWGLEGLNFMTSLDCSYNNLTNLPKSRWFDLISLECSNNNLNSLSGVEHFRMLTILDCSANRLTTLSELKNLENLENLNCNMNLLESLSGIESLKKLTHLSCALNNLTSLEELSHLKLISLDFSCNRLTSLSDIKALTSLETLICYNNSINNLMWAKGLINLIELDCSNNDFDNISAISSLTKLEILDCSDNNLTSLSGIENLTSLSRLYCGRNGLSTLSKIKNLTNLTELYCSGNQLTDLSVLKGFSNLLILSCINNELDSIKSVVASLQKLTILACIGNEISEDEINDIRSSFPNLLVNYISWNKLKELEKN